MIFPIEEIFEKIATGGPLMVLLMLLCVLMTTRGLISAVQLHYAHKQIKAILKTKTFGAKDTVWVDFAQYYLENRSGIDPIDSGLRETMCASVTLNMCQGRSVLVCASVATLIGLLGTVMGMVSSFNTIALFGFIDISSMADGVAQALITTQSGLLVAVIGVVLGRMVKQQAKAFSVLLNDFLLKTGKAPKDYKYA